MKGHLYGILPTTPFLLGNSASAMAGLIGIIAMIAICIGVIWGVIKWIS
jgi:hypothetical protein